MSGSGNANINSSSNINVVNNPIATTALTLSGSGDANLTASIQVNIGSSTMTSPVAVGTSSGSLNIVSDQRTLVQGATASARIRVIDFSAMTCTGDVSIQANAAGTTAGSFDGALILNSSIVSYDGDINLTSVSGTAGGSFGLYFRRSATSGTERIQAGGTAAPFGSGNVNINATGRATANDAIRIGFNIFGDANQITGTSGSGNLTITANSANGDGIQLINDGSINFISGTGDILITATSTGLQAGLCRKWDD